MRKHNQDYLLSLPWWLHVICNMPGKVLICNNINEEDIKGLISLGNTVYGLDTDIVIESEKFININYEDVRSSQFDIILINRIRLHIEDHELLNNLDELLTSNGIVCMSLPNVYSLKNILKGIVDISYIRHTISRKSIAGIHNNLSLLAIYPTAVYGGEVFESQMQEIYYTNKNSHTIKEKLKKLLYSSLFRKIIVDSYIYIIGNKHSGYSDIVNTIYKEIINVDEVKWATDHIVSIKAFYKYGKVLLSLSSRADLFPEYMAIICLDGVTQSQRLTEVNNITYLKNAGVLTNYLPNAIGPISSHGLVFFLITELEGVTVEDNSRKHYKIMDCAYDVINELTEKTIIYKFCLDDVVSNKLDHYISDLNIRYPANDKLHNELRNMLIKNIQEYGICQVFMHGDYKIENIIFNPHNWEINGIIDWELSDQDGFLLIDLFYLIIYNMQIKYGLDFIDAFNKLMINDIDALDEGYMNKYRNKYKINDDQYLIYKSIFFVHHFARRYIFDVDDQVYLDKYKSALRLISISLQNKTEV